MASFRGTALSRLVLGAPVAVVLLAGFGVEADGRQCCFTNPGFSGTCQVTIAKVEPCSAVLDYLNTPNTTGQDYCNNTEIRGGWTPVACTATDKGGASATPTRPRTSMINERLGKSRRTPTPTVERTATTPTPAPGT